LSTSPINLILTIFSVKVNISSIQKLRKSFYRARHKFFQNLCV